jgi:bifunctional DNase/RNase
VLLKEIDGLRYLPIWLGSAEATAIAFVQQQVKPPRPLTHDLFHSVLETFDIDLESVYLTKLEDGIFYAQLNFADSKFVSARPSDAIALALRSNSPIMASLTLLDEAGIEIPDQAEDEVERFKEFLDQINPEDFLA